MADSYTTNLNLTKPEVGASADSWGAKTNGDWDAVDSVFNAAGNGTSVGLNVGTGKTLNVAGSVTGGVLATVSGTQTLTGKTISGSSNTLTNIPLASAVSGTLPIGNGGTGLNLTPGSNQVLVGNGSGYSLATLTAGSNVSITNSGGSITISSTAAPTGVTSVANGGTGLSSLPALDQILLGTGTGYSLYNLIAGNNVTLTKSGPNLTISASINAITGTVGTGNGGTGLTSTPALNQLLVGNGSGYSLATLTAGSKIQIVNSGGALTLSTTAFGSSDTIPVGNGGTGLTSTPASNQVLVGNGTGYSLLSLAGSNITITNSGGYLTFNGNAGTVTSVTGTGSVGGLTLSGSGSSGGVTLTLSGSVDANQLSGTVLKSTVVSSSLTSVGTLTSLTVSGNSTTNGTHTAGTLSVTGNGTTSGTHTVGTLSVTGNGTTNGTHTIGTLSVTGNGTTTGTHTIGTLWVTGAALLSSDTTVASGGRLFVQTNSSKSTPGLGNTDIGGAWNTDATAGPGFFCSRTSGAQNMILNNNAAANLIECRYQGTGVGSVAITSTATSFNTSSDYRLKENFEPLTGALSRLQNLNVYRFNWKAAPGGPKVDGFIAHEVTPVVPEAISGEKDAVNDDGSIKPQGIDQSKLVPLLVAALQEANNKIEALTARVAALEAR